MAVTLGISDICGAPDGRRQRALDTVEVPTLSRSVIGVAPVHPVPVRGRGTSKMRPMGVALLLLSMPLWTQAPPRAPYVATPPDVVSRMLMLAGVGPQDILYDLGCGDGSLL